MNFYYYFIFIIFVSPLSSSLVSSFLYGTFGFFSFTILLQPQLKLILPEQNKTQRQQPTARQQQQQQQQIEQKHRQQLEELKPIIDSFRESKYVQYNNAMMEMKHSK